MKKRVPSLEKTKKKLEELTTKLNEAGSKEEAIRVVRSYFKFSDSLDTDVTVISIRNTINTKDKVYEKAMNKINEILPVIQGYDQAFRKALVNSKFRKDLEETFGTLYFKMIDASFKVYDEKIIPLMVEENNLDLEYSKIMSGAEIEFKGETYSLTQLGKFLSDKDKEVREEAAKLYYGYLEENDCIIYF